MSVTRFESVSVAEHERRIVSVWLRTSVQACRCEHVLECVIHLAWARLAVSGTGPSSGAGKPGSGLGSLWLRAHSDLGVKFQPRVGGGRSPLFSESLKGWGRGGGGLGEGGSRAGARVHYLVGLRPLSDYAWCVSFPDDLRPSEDRQFRLAVPFLPLSQGKLRVPGGERWATGLLDLWPDGCPPSLRGAGKGAGVH